MRDASVPARLDELAGVTKFEPGLVLEGGSIDVNGAGTVLTTEQCLLHPNRNPGATKADLEAALRAYLGVQQVVWLGEGIEGDDTDGHVDDITRFVGPDTIVTAVEDDPSDANHEPLRDNLARLRAARQPERRTVADCHAADVRLRDGRRRTPASQLRELLHRQRRGARAGVRPRQRRGGDGDSPGSLPDAPGRPDPVRAAGVGHGLDPLRHTAAAAIALGRANLGGLR